MENLVEICKEIRVNCLKMVNAGKSSHIGAALSCVDILATLYFKVMDDFDVENLNRDVFILSKGHAGAALYATLAAKGYIEQEILKTHYQNGSILSGHVSHKGVNAVEFSTGSLGHGLPVATGIALAKKVSSYSGRSIVLMGDGEIAEGSNWESLLFASHQELDNLIIIVDRNRLQSFKSTEDTVRLESLEKKFKAFNCEVFDIDGHNMNEIYSSIVSSPNGMPKVIIANTIKGKGVSYMENKVEWHYKFPDDDQLKKAIEEINAK